MQAKHDSGPDPRSYQLDLIFPFLAAARCSALRHAYDPSGAFPGVTFITFSASRTVPPVTGVALPGDLRGWLHIFDVSSLREAFARLTLRDAQIAQRKLARGTSMPCRVLHRTRSQ